MEILFDEDFVKNANKDIICDAIYNFADDYYISNELLDIITLRNDKDINSCLIIYLISQCDDRVVNLLQYDHSHKTKILIAAIDKYQDTFYDSYFKFGKKILLLILSYDENYISFHRFLSKVLRNVGINVNPWIVSIFRLGDCINYCSFRIMKEGDLDIINVEPLEALCRNAIRFSAPKTFIDTLLKYIPKTSQLHIKEFRDNMVASIDAGLGYYSLFEEDV